METEAQAKKCHLRLRFSRRYREPDALFYRDNFAFPGTAPSIRVELRPTQVQILAPT